jgi:hypothetical protein
MPTFPRGELKKLYAAARYLDRSLETKLGLRIPFDVYFQDPLVAAEDPEVGFDTECIVDWEPGFGDGPTSARFAVVDYNVDAERLAPPAVWDEKGKRFRLPGPPEGSAGDGAIVDRTQVATFQFHQVNVWAIVQRALRFFEEPAALGRRLPWGFAGNRLIVVPHAGYGENAFYDRTSKSLQFYYFDREGQRSYTCLSTDIVHHELTHAVLDGVRPHLIESASVETAAFHEFLGDLVAILMALRNNTFRGKLAADTQGNLSEAEHLSSIAEEFGRKVRNRPYLRTARNTLTMADVAASKSAHHRSQVLTGAMFDILLALSRHYIDLRGRTAPQAFWDVIQRMQRMALQPLDLLPPVDVTFRDYALATLRAEQLANPTDPYGYRAIMLDVFVARGILDAAEAKELAAPDYVHDRLQLGVFHDVEQLACSKAAAYRFLDDNRDELLLPRNRDLVVSDLYCADKMTRQARRLPRQYVLVYTWREDTALEGPRFGKLAGSKTGLLCGGTLVFDENGSVLWWTRKPGPIESDSKNRKAEAALGAQRQQRLLDDVAERLAMGQIASAPESTRGLLASRFPPFVAREEAGGRLRFELSPHLAIDDDDETTDPSQGARRWQISS